jgi:hypothetical protein
VDVEIKQRCTTDIGDVSESESEDDIGHEEEEIVAEDVANVKSLKKESLKKPLKCKLKNIKNKK